MTRPLAVLGVLVVLLAVWHRALGQREERLRAERSRVGKLLSPEERDEAPQMAAVRIETGRASYLYGRIEGMWRCRELHMAPADVQGIESLVKKLTEAEGVVHTSEADEAPTYGLNTTDEIRVYLCGKDVMSDPAGDVIFGFEIGKAIPGRDGAFVRRLGQREVWAIDANPRQELERRLSPDLPPLLSPSCVPRSWPGWHGGFRQVFVDFAASGYELRRELIEIDPSELKPGEVPFRWFLVHDGTSERAAEGPAIAFTRFLSLFPYADVLPRDRRDELGFRPPRATVTLAAAEGQPFELLLGAPLPDGRVPVWTPSTQTLYLVTPEIAELVAPSADRFRPGSDENPWDPYLREATPSGPPLPR